jgi:hypothetical protein
MSLGMKPDNFQPPLSGTRRQIADTQAIRFPNRWLETTSERRDQFLEWRYIAMQVIQRNGGPFRLIAIFDEVFDLDTCECLASDEELAIEAGRCSSKTASRELRALRSLGLIIAETHWIEKAGKKVKGRRVRLAVPSDLSGIHLR